MEGWIPKLAGLPLPDEPRIVDGGANKGAVTARLLEALPGCRVTAFEPQPRLARKLVKRFRDDPRVTVVPAALGEGPASLPLAVLSRPTLSSLLPPTGIRDKYAGEDLPVTETVAVPVVRLDGVLDRVDGIKLDVQGYELPALRGAANLLSRVAVVVAEIARYPLYEGQAMLPEVEAFLEEYGLGLEGVYDCYRDASGRIASGDALFVRK